MARSSPGLYFGSNGVFSPSDCAAFLSVVESGGVAAAACSIGWVVAGRADSEQVLECLHSWQGRERELMLCLPEADSVWQWWDRSVCTKSLRSFMSFICLDLGVFVAPASGKAASLLRLKTRKLPVWICSSGCFHHLFSSCRHVLAGIVVPRRHFSVECFNSARSAEYAAALKSGCPGTDVIAAADDEKIPHQPFIIDVSSFDWRVLQLGVYTFSELCCFSGKRLILSGDVPVCFSSRHLISAGIVVYKGTAERISRRILQVLENNGKMTGAVLFASSRTVFDNMSKFLKDGGCGDVRIIRMDEEALKTSGFTSRQLIDLFENVRFEENMSTIAVEFSEDEALAEFMEHISRTAHQTVNLDYSQESSLPSQIS